MASKITSCGAAPIGEAALTAVALLAGPVPPGPGAGSLPGDFVSAEFAATDTDLDADADADGEGRVGGVVGVPAAGAGATFAAELADDADTGAVEATFGVFNSGALIEAG